MGDLHGVGGPARGSSFRHSALTAGGLSLLFVGVYSFCNWHASRLPDVPTLSFAWEHYIPLIPIFIIPYMSVDLFFVGAPFLCSSNAERGLLARRIALAIVVAGICFFFFPLRLAFPRPVVEGWLGPIFGFLQGFDQPHNLLPSLHIALRTILADTYVRHTRRWVRVLCHVWFSLIGFSTLFTHQHQVLDVVAGFALAAVCFYALRPRPLDRAITLSTRIAVWYALGSLGSAAAGVLLWPWGSILLWPAASLACAAVAYVHTGAWAYRKESGTIPLSARVIMAPVLLGHVVSKWFYSRQCDPWNEVVPRVLLGRHLSPSEADAALKSGVTAVLDLTAEFGAPRSLRNLAYQNLPVLDLTAPTPQQLAAGVAFIARHVEAGTVYVHCKIGYSRSATFVAAYLLASGQAGSAAEAIDTIRRARPSVVIRPEARRAIAAYEQSLR